MTGLDWAIIAVIGISALVGVLRGFVREALSLTSWILALWVAWRYSGDLAAEYLGFIGNPNIEVVAGFAVVFVVVLLVATLISYLVAKLVAASALSSVDRTLGLVFGCARGALIIVALMVFGDGTALTREPWWQQSMLAGHFHALATVVLEWIPQDVARLLGSR